MAKKIEVVLLGVASGWQNKVFTDNLFDVMSRDGLLIIKGQVYSEERLATTLRGSSLSQSLIKVHCHYLIHVALFIENLQSLDQVPHRS